MGFSLLQSQQGHWDLKTWAIRLPPASTFSDLLWWVHRVEPGVLSAYARMYWPPIWPPASTQGWGFGWPWTKQLFWEPQVAAHAHAQASSCIGWTQPGKMCASALCPNSSLSQVTQKTGKKERQSLNTLSVLNTLTNQFCGPKTKTYISLFSLL